MWRVAAGIGLVVVGVTGVYQLMKADAHFAILAWFGAVCGAASGYLFGRRVGLLAGGVLGFIFPLVYLPLWFIFDLPPAADWDL